ncbi:uncharacterized protein RJT21DRAFT_117413 [Scheffersomyces amazonensis]|uniref:uncharacterized protein n=1 Tax=Scheffersomyces amazonensis TaxID=1078765 RepID=UPI00315DE27B
MFLRSQIGGRIFRTGVSSVPSRTFIPKRSFNLASKLQGLGRYGLIINILSGAYFGGILVCMGSLYFIYQDANERQHIPFWDLSLKQKITAVKAINKDDVLRSPRYSVKHYKRLLIDLYKQENPDQEIDETKFEVPLIDSNVLIYEKSNTFANFYIDIILRYSKALLAKGQLDASIYMLSSIINNDELFFRLGDTERLSECCRLLSKVTPNPEDKLTYLKRSILNIQKTFPTRIKLNDNYLLQDGSLMTDELMKCLNDLAFNYVKQNHSDEGLNIYFTNLKYIKSAQHAIADGSANQTNYPYFNADEQNLKILSVKIRSYISEILWSKGFKKNSIAWNEDIIEECFFEHSSSQPLTIILNQVLTNLITMYDSLHNLTSRNRCEKMKQELTNFVDTRLVDDWYFNLVNRFSRIIYHRGPLGIIEKPLLERFGAPNKLPEIEEMEDEDVE